MWRFLSLVVALFGISFGMAWGIKQLGLLQPRVETYLEIGDCELPCWNNLKPGRDTMGHFALAIMDVEQDGGWMYSGVPSSYDGETLHEYTLTIRATPQIRLGDLLMVYGPPQGAYILEAASTNTPGGRRFYTQVVMYWENGYLQASAIGPDSSHTTHLLPEMWVSQLALRDDDTPPPYSDVSRFQAWHGLGNTGLYEIQSP